MWPLRMTKNDVVSGVPDRQMDMQYAKSVNTCWTERNSVATKSISSLHCGDFGPEGTPITVESNIDLLESAANK